MTALPDVYEALLASWRAAKDQLGLDESQIFDGPQVSYVDSEGITVGAAGPSATDARADFDHGPSDLAREWEQGVALGLLWSGSGDAVFKPHRDRARAMLAVVRAELVRDRTLGRVVSTSRLVGGSLEQVQTGRGALVTIAFRIAYKVL